jgi:hypothetical protein
MIKIFYSSPYNIQHKNINPSNAEELLKDDIRSKIIGNVKEFIYGNDGIKIKGNSNILYLGGFYYEKNKFEDSKYGKCENTVRCELEQIDNSDIVFVSLLKYSAIASITEMIYASFKGKKIIAFCDKNITQFKTEYEYWFPLITSMIVNNSIEIVYVENEEEIINYINNLKEE